MYLTPSYTRPVSSFDIFYAAYLALTLALHRMKESISHIHIRLLDRDLLFFPDSFTNLWVCHYL